MVHPILPQQSVKRTLVYSEFNRTLEQYMLGGLHRISALETLTKHRGDENYSKTFIEILSCVHEDCRTAESLEEALKQLPFESNGEKIKLHNVYFAKILSGDTETDDRETIEKCDFQMTTLIHRATRTVFVTGNENFIQDFIQPAYKELLQTAKIAPGVLFERLSKEPVLEFRKIHLAGLLRACASLNHPEFARERLNDYTINFSKPELTSLIESIYESYRNSPDYNRKLALELIKRESEEHQAALSRYI